MKIWRPQRCGALNSWMLKAIKLLVKFKFLRGTQWDIFGYTKERRMERSLICAYKQMMTELLLRPSSGNHECAVKLAQLPEQTRGFGQVKARNVEVAEQKKNSY